MGIVKDQLNILAFLKSKNSKIFEGSTLLISQNAIYATEKEVVNILKKHSVELNTKKFLNNKFNLIPEWKNTKKKININAYYLFHLLGSETIACSDVSKYEDPDYIIDLNYPIELKYHNKFDNIVDPGTFEHVFNTPQLLDNYTKMLKIGGYLFISTTCSNLIDHGFYSFSPTMFFDYFEKNGFKIKNCFLKEYSPYMFEKKGKIFEYIERGPEIPFISSKSVEIIVCCEKVENLEKQYFPIQYVYNQEKKMNIEKKGKNFVYNFLRKIIFHFLNYSPFFYEKFIFRYIRGKKIIRRNIND